jgi:hypothetical protein
MSENKNGITQTDVGVYNSATPMFFGLLREVKALSGKKPDATLSKNKVKIVNRVLEDLLTILKKEPSGQYLELLDDDALPQISDALLTMVQFEAALRSFRSRYTASSGFGKSHWVTTDGSSIADE